MILVLDLRLLSVQQMECVTITTRMGDLLNFEEC